jgi:hypothetical protein
MAMAQLSAWLAPYAPAAAAGALSRQVSALLIPSEGQPQLVQIHVLPLGAPLDEDALVRVDWMSKDG